MQIVKSFLPGVSNEEFRMHHTTNCAMTFISHERLLKESINDNLRPTEEVIGLKIDHEGVMVYIRTKK